MTNEELNKALYDKMRLEMENYTSWLKSMPTEDILNHTYEYTVRQDILYAFEDFNLPDEECRALLKSPCPLSDIVDRFNNLETDYMENIRNSIEAEAKSTIRKEQNREER